MSAPMPTKPKFSKGFTIYTVIAIILYLLLIFLVVSGNNNFNGVADLNNDGVIDMEDKIASEKLLGTYRENRNNDRFLLIVVPIFLFCPVLIYLAAFIGMNRNYKLAITDYPAWQVKEIKRADKQLSRLNKQLAIAEEKQAELDAEYQIAVNSQKAAEPWAKEYSTSPCPYCGHYKVRSAKWEDKSISVAFWGIASSKIGTNYKCEYCNRMWE